MNTKQGLDMLERSQYDSVLLKSLSEDELFALDIILALTRSGTLLQENEDRLADVIRGVFKLLSPQDAVGGQPD